LPLKRPSGAITRALDKKHLQFLFDQGIIHVIILFEVPYEPNYPQNFILFLYLSLDSIYRGWLF